MDYKVQNKLDVSVLFVENESVKREKFAEMISKHVKKLYLAKDGNEGLALFREHKPEIVVTNLTLPYMNGIELVQKIKAVHDDTHIIMTVARNDLNYLIESIDTGISHYVLKPLEKEKLLAAVRKCADMVMLRRKIEQQNEHIMEFYLAVEHGPDIVIITDSKGNIEYSNPKFSGITGYSKEEAIGKTLAILKSDEVDTEAYTSLWNSIKSGNEWQGKLANRKKDGECYWASVSIFPVKDSKGQIGHFVYIQEDITGWKLTEEDLRVSEEMFKVLTMLAQDAIVMVDDRGRTNFWNEAAERMFGLPTTDAIGKELWDFMPSPEVREIFENKIKTYKETCQCSVSGNIIEQPALKNDGTLFPVEVSITAVHIRDKCHSIAIIRDITQRKQIEQNVLNEREKFQTLSENAPFGIMLVDKNGVLKYLNPNFIELFGYKHEEIPDGKSWFRKAFPESEYRHDVIGNWIKDMEDPIKGKKEPWVLTVTCKNGTQKIVDFFPVKLSSGESVIFCQDLTELKKNERKLLYISSYDFLTGLPNRHSMEEALRQAIELAKKGKKRGGLSALLFTDLDGFKDINAKLGHIAGDELLIAAAKMLKNALRGGDSVYRFGGDEFVILFRGVSMAEAKLAAERIQRTVNQHEFTVDYEKFKMDISMGIIQVDGAMDPVTLLSKAVNTLYKAKKLGRNHIAVYQGE
ncbi:MAG: PAS domain S-box protein [Proteobacteria bacterium]|nr:PAS domain S-box protein [Pseudomonadota bacterium]